MKRYHLIAGLVLSLCAGLTQAATCETQIASISDLSDAAKAAMVVQCNQEKLNKIQNVASGITPSAINEWGAVSKDFAVALGIAAKELGIATNEFLGTNAGKLTAGLIIWHVAGESLIGIIIGVPMLIVLWYTLLSILRRSRIRSIVYDESGKRHWWGPKVVTEITYQEIDENRLWLTFLCGLGLIVGTFAICGLLIFP